MNTAFTVSFCFDKEIALNNRRKLREFIVSQLKKHGKSGAEVNFVFCSDEALLKINKEHLNHDYYTDIITFDLSDKGSSILVSDIFISVDRVRDNAKTENVAVKDELQRVIFHGLLHLIGYKDKSTAQKAQMRTMEDEWMSGFSKISA